MISEYKATSAMSMAWMIHSMESYLGKSTFVADRKAKAALSCPAPAWPQQFSVSSDSDTFSAKQPSLIWVSCWIVELLIHGDPNDLASSLACLLLYFALPEDDNLYFTHLSKLGGGGKDWNKTARRSRLAGESTLLLQKQYSCLFM